MNLQTSLPPDLWQAIQENYEKREYTSAILDCCYFLSDLIRQRSGLDGDGAPLIGQAFGGPNPKIKIAKDQSESEQNTQKGIESILRGFYQAIRNPRSHKKILDNHEDAMSVIMFCGYIVRQIDKAKSPASKEAFVQRILDPDFVPSKRYSELLVQEIPPGLKVEILLGLLSQVKIWNPKSLKFFIEQLVPTLSSTEKKLVAELLSSEFIFIEDDDSIRNLVYCFPSTIWNEVSEIGRLRIENKIIRSILLGRFDKKSRKCLSGAMATWAREKLPHFQLRRELFSALYSKLASHSAQERNYALEFFVNVLANFDRNQISLIESLFTRKLNEGNSEFHSALFLSSWTDEHWGPELKTAYENFSAKEIADMDDEIPF